MIVDEAHAVLGPSLSTSDATILRVGTLSKTLGALGGFVAGPRPFIDLMINAARAFIALNMPKTVPSTAQVTSGPSTP